MKHNLLVWFSCFDPKKCSLNLTSKLGQLTKTYDDSFSDDDHAIIRSQQKICIILVRRHPVFSSCTDVGCLATKMIETEKHMTFPLVYKLIELALLQLVSIASV